ncbi:uncharacterized protein [Prorops nasuta]|uniref:uncharacterized protein n=1 Tax=Prorops nasuta TaxID=863751 RepID=UPI0034CF9028
MDHQDYCNVYCPNDFDDEDDSACNFLENNNLKRGDELLIELYKERPFLYDKKEKNFKDTIMKSNAWMEISKLMIEINEDNLYTPTYCQKRCNSLRDQYNKEKRRINDLCKSGSGAPKSSQFPYSMQLSFLDKIIKRRRSYTNSQINSNQQSVSINEDTTFNSAETNADKENGGSGEQQRDNSRSSSVLGEECFSKIKKRCKIDETKSLESTLVNIGNSISNYIKKKEENTYKADDAFINYLKAQFDTFDEKEKLKRKKMIMDVLIAPIE